MSHEIQQFDKQFGLSQAWHGLTEVREDLALDNEDFYLSQWDVKEAHAHFFVDDEEIKMISGSGERSSRAATDCEGEKGEAENVCKKLYIPMEEGNLSVSGVYGDSYTPLSNEKFLSIIKASLDACGLPYTVESVGSVFNRRRTFVSIPLHGLEDFKTGEREFKAYLNFQNSFDGSCAFLANTSNVCTVCNNTFSANLREGGALIKHTKNMLDRLENLPEVIAEAINVQKEFANDFLTLHSLEVREDHAKALCIAFLSKAKLSTRGFNTSERLIELFNTGKGNAGKTYADLFSAFTDFYSHESAGGDDANKQFVSSEFGSGADKKREAMQFLMKCLDVKAEAKRQIDKGNDLLKEYLAK